MVSDLASLIARVADRAGTGSQWGRGFSAALCVATVAPPDASGRLELATRPMHLAPWLDVTWGAAPTDLPPPPAAARLFTAPPVTVSGPGGAKVLSAEDTLVLSASGPELPSCVLVVIGSETFALASAAGAAGAWSASLALGGVRASAAEQIRFQLTLNATVVTEADLPTTDAVFFLPAITGRVDVATPSTLAVSFPTP